jgi:predicted ArsR family transcriptional regulator
LSTRICFRIGPVDEERPVSPVTAVAAVAALDEPVRRRLYTLVAEHDEPVSREAAAAALGVARSVAAFHLDRLADLGLLEVEFRRPPGRSGPGAGRPAKLYRRSVGEIAVTLPERHYDLAADLLAGAIDAASDDPGRVREALSGAARRHGRAVGARLDVGGEPLAARLRRVLTEAGYEARSSGRTITLANCPFHVLAERHREVVCSMNQDLLAGVCEAAGLPPSAARLDPAPGRCCVTLDVEAR